MLTRFLGPTPGRWAATARLGVYVLVCAALVTTFVLRGQAQQPQPPNSTAAEQDRSLDRQALREADRAAEAKQPPAERKPAAAADTQSLNLWDLTVAGGPLMVPIIAFSVIVVLVAIERGLGIRRERVIPQGLVDALGRSSATHAPFDPRRAFRVCQEHPSAAANVIKAMLLKLGRPLPEVEHAVAEASNREATLLYKNARWLNLSASVAPLLGLLGTIQGMILAFFETSILEAGQNRAQQLASGIYMALITTFAGLVVAIPATMLAYYFEGRIQTLFHQIEELVGSLLPQVERFEGKLRAPKRTTSEADDMAPPEPQLATTPK